MKFLLLSLLFLNINVSDQNFQTCINDNFLIQNKDENTLTYLNCANQNISNIDGISKLKNLVSVDLRGNNLKNIPKEIKDLQFLNDLNLENNWLQDYHVLENVFSLKYLYLGNNEIKKMSSNINNLEVLNLSGNNLLSVPNLNSNFLKELNLSTNRIIAVNNLNTPNLRNINLRNNQVFNFKFNFPLNKLNLDDNLFEINNLYGFDIHNSSFVNLMNKEVDVINGWSNPDFDLRSNTILSNGYMLQGFNRFELVDESHNIIKYDGFLKNKKVIKEGFVEGFLKISFNNDFIISKEKMKINFKIDQKVNNVNNENNVNNFIFRPTNQNGTLNISLDIFLGTDLKKENDIIISKEIWEPFLKKNYFLDKELSTPFFFDRIIILNILLFLIMMIPAMVLIITGRKFFKTFV